MAGKKQLAMLGGAAILLVAVIVAVVVTVTHHGHPSSAAPSAANGGSASLQTTIKAIKSICQPTDYKETCEKTLESVAGNVTDPKELVQLTFQAAHDNIGEGLKHSMTLDEVEKDPRTRKALKDCQELLNYAMDDLKTSFEQLGGLDITKIDKIITNLKVWLSAAVTYQETCLDGFENTTSNAGQSMRDALKTSAELTSNTLAIVNEISSVLGSFKVPVISRRLLSEAESAKFPSWVSDSKRRLLSLSPLEMKPNVVVAKDGSGNYKTINEALAAVPKNNKDYFVIYIRQGVYAEYVEVGKSLTHVVMIGDGPTKTKITGNLNYIDGTPTFKTATVAVVGDGFIAKGLGIENTAGAEKHQAVALRVGSDMSVFYQCQIDGYQDTLYVHTKRQFYRDCTISGTIDFIFGDSSAVFQNCKMVVRKPMDNQQNIVTAQGRKDRHEATAIVLHNCTITADPALVPYMSKIPTYLGRPWKEYSRTFIFQSQLDELINPQGWLPWLGDFGLKTCFYSELENRGAGAGLVARATWRGIKKVTYQHADMFTVESFIQGSQWLPNTGVPFYPGLLPQAESGRIH